MNRVCFMLRINRGQEPRYDELHLNMPGEVRIAIEAAGLCNYSLFRSSDLVIGYVEVQGDFQIAMGVLQSDPSFQQWARLFNGIFPETGNGVAKITELKEIWHVD